MARKAKFFSPMRKTFFNGTKNDGRRSRRYPLGGRGRRAELQFCRNVRLLKWSVSLVYCVPLTSTAGFSQYFICFYARSGSLALQEMSQEASGSACLNTNDVPCCPATPPRGIGACCWLDSASQRCPSFRNEVKLAHFVAWFALGVKPHSYR